METLQQGSPLTPPSNSSTDMEPEPQVDNKQNVNPLTADWVRMTVTGKTTEKEKQHHENQLSEDRNKETGANRIE